MEPQLIDVDNDTLKSEFAYFKSICHASKDHEARTEFLLDLEKLFDEADQNHNGTIDRKEFEGLISGYFNLKGI